MYFYFSATVAADEFHSVPVPLNFLRLFLSNDMFETLKRVRRSNGCMKIIRPVTALSTQMLQNWSRESSVSLVTVLRLHDGGGDFLSLRYRIQIGSGAHSASCAMGTGVFSPGIKRLGRETDLSPPSSAEVRNAWSYTSTHPYVIVAWCLV
jgi:hypothetical protein